MAAIRFLAGLCFVVMTVLPIGDGQTCCRPAIHLDGNAPGAVYFHANQVIDRWSASGGNGHVSGGMVYAHGQITVPVSGLYYVYCQVYYHKITNGAARHEITLNNHRTVALGNLASKDQFDSSSYTGLSLMLNQGDKIACKIGPHAIKVWAGPFHTFFGAYAL